MSRDAREVLRGDPVRAAVIIPARFGSERLPGKPLLRETGKFLIQHVHEKAREATTIGRVIIATDHPEIEDAARSFGGEVRMTDPDHPSGTDRVAEVARDVQEEIVVNIQGDEPEIDPADIDKVARLLEEDPRAGMATLAFPLAEGEEDSPDQVKVVRDRQGYALYFSRSPIPYRRGRPAGPILGHVGIYAYRREVLQDLASSPRTPLEESEGLEQLRALEKGIRIRVGDATGPTVGVDTREDYERFVRRHQKGQ